MDCMIDINKLNKIQLLYILNLAEQIENNVAKKCITCNKVKVLCEYYENKPKCKKCYCDEVKQKVYNVDRKKYKEKYRNKYSAYCRSHLIMKSKLNEYFKECNIVEYQICSNCKNKCMECVNKNNEILCQNCLKESLKLEVNEMANNYKFKRGIYKNLTNDEIIEVRNMFNDGMKKGQIINKHNEKSPNKLNLYSLNKIIENKI